jgi:hypothetical protein
MIMASGTMAAFWAVSFLFVITPGADWAYVIAAGLRHRVVLPAVGGLLVGLNRPGFRAASFLVRKDAIMPKHYDAEVKARAVRLVAEHKVESGSVTKSCEAVGRRLGISKENLAGVVSPSSGRRR